MGQLAQSEYRKDLDTQPVYNIKAVVEATGLPAATLRAWERRYGALVPQRTENGYRLYSAHDVALLRWLKLRVDEGMSISQAIALLSYKRLDEPLHSVSQHRPGLSGVRDALVDSLLSFDEGRAGQIIEEVLAIHDVELVAERIIAPAMIRIGDLWHKGDASIAAEHFASHFLRRKIDAIISAAPKNNTGPLIIMGCAPDDWHELGLLLFYLMLRRRNLSVIYLGQNVPRAQFAEEMKRLLPKLVIISASTTQAVAGLIDLAETVQVMSPPRPVFAYGGHIFNANPQLRQAVPGIFLGESTRAAVESVVALVSQPAAPEADLRTDAAVSLPGGS